MQPRRSPDGCCFKVAKTLPRFLEGRRKPRPIERRSGIGGRVRTKDPLDRAPGEPDGFRRNPRAERGRMHVSNSRASRLVFFRPSEYGPALFFVPRECWQRVRHPERRRD